MSTDALDLLTQEIETAKKDRRPTSRHSLAALVSERTGMPYRDALAVVEAYCEQTEPAIPEYLSGEFGIFWLKVVAVANVAVGVFILWTSVQQYRRGQPAWPLWCLGTVFCGLGTWFWVRSLEAEVRRRR